MMVLTACQGPKTLEPGQRPVPLLLISIDGFRHDYFDLADTPALDRLVRGGLKADSLLHAFPTKTFPTHYTLVTGLHPGTHGVVANSMWDPLRDSRFSLGNREAVGDGYWYEAGEPIWVTAERQGLTAATFFWPGSEARIHRIRPTHWKVYDGRVPHLERIEQVLAWIDLPEAERPDLYTLYFSTVDSEGHRHGPRADPVRDALIDVDYHLGLLLDGMEERGLLDAFHIILVSDHGMSRVDFDQYIMLDDYLDLSKVLVSDWGPAAQIWATETSVDDIMASLENAHPRMRVWRREDIPERYHFGTHHRVPDVLAEADLEWMISNKPYMAGRSRFSLMGMHGWDPAWLEMHGLFVAFGPSFPADAEAPAVRSVDIYELMTHLLRLNPADNEGSLSPFRPYLEGDFKAPRQLHFQCGQETLEARLGSAHMSLHWNQQVHVLNRIHADAGEHFEAVGLEFRISNDQASANIDDNVFENCRQSASSSSGEPLVEGF